jgi:hypothetical protein
MPARRLPNSVPSVIRTLKAARDEWKNTVNPADRAISAEQWAQLDDADNSSLLSRLLKEASDVDLAQAAQAPLTSGLAQSAAKLTMCASHFHQVLDLGVARGTFAAGARSYYGRDITATSIPDLSTYEAVADAAEKIVAGETARKTAEGAAHLPMNLPSAAEVGAVAAQFNTLLQQSNQAQEFTDKQRGELNGVYPAAQQLAVDICDTVEFFYRKEADPATFRSKTGRWGVVYVFNNNGTPAPAPAPAQAG